jgi:hypothetical protein
MHHFFVSLAFLSSVAAQGWTLYNCCSRNGIFSDGCNDWDCATGQKTLPILNCFAPGVPHCKFSEVECKPIMCDSEDGMCTAVDSDGDKCPDKCECQELPCMMIDCAPGSDIVDTDSRGCGGKCQFNCNTREVYTQEKQAFCDAKRLSSSKESCCGNNSDNTWFDGCNTCSCSGACTKMYCGTSEPTRCDLATEKGMPTCNDPKKDSDSTNKEYYYNLFQKVCGSECDGTISYSQAIQANLPKEWIKKFDTNRDKRYDFCEFYLAMPSPTNFIRVGDCSKGPC